MSPSDRRITPEPDPLRALPARLLRGVLAGLGEGPGLGRSTHRRRGGLSRFCRDRLLIVPEAGNALLPLVLNPVQRLTCAIKLRTIRSGRPRRFLVLKARRTGLTTLEQAQSYRLAATHRHTHAVTIADTMAKTVEVFRILTTMWQHDPQQPPREGPGHQGSLRLIGLDSRIQALTAGAATPGRGLTLQRVHGSEVAFWCGGLQRVRRQERILAGLEEAARAGEIVLESTANGTELFHGLWQEAKRGQNPWTPIFLPWMLDPANAAPPGSFDAQEIRDTLTDDERALIERTLSEWGVRLDESRIAWRRDKQRRLKADFPQEYPEDDQSCFLLSGRPYFDKAIVRRLLEACPPVEQGLTPLRDGRAWVWQEPISGVSYAIGSDTSEGLPQGDPNGFGVLRCDTWEQVASVHGRFPPRRLAQLLDEWGRKYHGAVVAVERENHGHAVLMKLIDVGYPRLHHAADGKPGWSTNAKTRPLMLAELAEAIEESQMAIRDRLLLSECLSFVKSEAGRWAAAAGAHDDSVMKWAITLQAAKGVPKRREKMRFGAV